MSLFPICDLCKHNGYCYRKATGKVCKTVPKKFKNRVYGVYKVIKETKDK